MMDENASFLRARDPSILAWNRPAIKASIRMDLCSAFSNESNSLENDDQSENESTDQLQVFLRIKPAEKLDELYEFEDRVLTCRVPVGSQALRNIHEGAKMIKQFSFTKIYGPEVNQTDLFNNCIKSKVLDFINGKNYTIFTYGTSGSGKTFTILGTPDEPGIIPRSLEYVFRTIPPVESVPNVKPTQSGEVTVLDQNLSRSELRMRSNILNVSNSSFNKSTHIQTYKLMQQRLSTEPNAILCDTNNVSIGMWVSFAEVYNEYVYDLLQGEPPRGKQRPKLRLGQDSKGNTYIRDLINISVSSGLEAYEILQYGMNNLNYASTAVNSHSSRSHCIFTIKLVQLSPDSEAQISLLNFCDLAGSERVKLTRNIGERLKESNNINTSLHVLGRCIKSIRDSQKSQDSRLIPFRDSKLTRLFQGALSGLESIAMIVNINATRDMFDESQHVLNFAAIAQDIKIEKAVKSIKTATNKRFSQYMQNKNNILSSINESDVDPSEVDVLREQVLSLSLELERQRQLHIERESSIRQDLVNKFHARYTKSQEEWKERKEEEKQSLTELYECKIEHIQKQYENELNQQRKRPRVSIIELDDTIDEDLDDLKEELQGKSEKMENIQSNLNESQIELTQKAFEISTLISEIDSYKGEIKKLSDEVLNLTKSNVENSQLLKDAATEFKDMEIEKNDIEKQLEERTCDLLNLQKEYLDLQELNSQLSKQIDVLHVQIENIENLEEDKENDQTRS